MSTLKDDWGTWLMRTVLVGMSGITLGIMGFVGNRIIGELDGHRSLLYKLESHASSTSNTVSLIQQEMALRRQQQEADKAETRTVLSDHEVRIRGLERGGRIAN